MIIIISSSSSIIMIINNINIMLLLLLLWLILLVLVVTILHCIIFEAIFRAKILQVYGFDAIRLLFVIGKIPNTGKFPNMLHIHTSNMGPAMGFLSQQQTRWGLRLDSANLSLPDCPVRRCLLRRQRRGLCSVHVLPPRSLAGFQMGSGQTIVYGRATNPLHVATFAFICSHSLQ